MFLRSEMSAVGPTSPNMCNVSEDISLLTLAAPRVSQWGPAVWMSRPGLLWALVLLTLLRSGSALLPSSQAWGLPTPGPPFPQLCPHLPAHPHTASVLAGSLVSAFSSPWWVPLGPRGWPALTLADAGPFHLVLVLRFLPGAVQRS